MEQTLLLCRVLGTFLVIVGAAILLRWRYFVPVFADYVEHRLTRTVVSMAELLAGLFLIGMHNDWSSLPAGFISALGWLAAIEGATFLLLPDRKLSGLMRALNKPAWYVVGGAIALVLGICLAGYGFGIGVS